jgi:diadenosine tetraphosphate (Ap4A) HIT family hydrolase
MMFQSYKNLRDGPLNNSCIPCTPPQNEKFLIGFTDAWKVILHPHQAHIGSCLVTTRRHVGQLTNLTENECADFLNIIQVLETALKTAFKIDLLNYLCLMNWAYRRDNPVPSFKDGRPNPHVHWHLITRFEQPIKFRNYTFDDPCFGDPYDATRQLDLPDGVINSIRQEILQHLDVTYIDT